MDVLKLKRGLRDNIAPVHAAGVFVFYSPAHRAGGQEPRTMLLHGAAV